MASEAAAERLGVKSLCEAFQNTAAARPEVVALRVPGGRGGITWAEYAGRVERIAAGLFISLPGGQALDGGRVTCGGGVGQLVNCVHHSLDVIVEGRQ